MKKKIIKYSILIALLCALVVGVYFAFFTVDSKTLAKNNVSEMGEHVFTAKEDCTSIKLYSGMRENPYSLNGVHEEMQNFALIIFRTDELNVESPTFIATIDGTSYNGILEQNPYDNTFVADLETSISQNSIVEICVTVKDSQYNYNLVNVNKDWAYTFNDALEIGLNELLNDIEMLISGKTLACELYVKAINDSVGTFDTFFYHVSYIDTNGNAKGVVIDVQTGQVIKE